MEEEEDVGEGPSTPFWLQSSTKRRRLSSFFLSSGLLIFVLCLSAVVSIFFVIPSVVSFTSYVVRPTVKQASDSLNIVLLLLALVFGFLSRNRNGDNDRNRNVSSPVVGSEIQKSNPSTPRQEWYEYADRTVYGSSAAVNGGGLRRNSCSYPDLRDASPWVNAGDDRWRFSDDLLVESHRYSESDRFRRRLSWKRIYEEEEVNDEQAAPVTRVNEDSYTPPLPPPPTDLHQKPKRAYESVAQREQVKELLEQTRTLAPPAAAPPPPPSPPPPPVDSEKKSSKSDRKRRGPNATKDLFTSIYNQKNSSTSTKKKRRQKSVDSFETLIQPQAPPPPPSPPPPSALHNLFSSHKGRSKIITVPPPSTTARASTSTAIIPFKTSGFVQATENSSIGGESPLTGCESPLIPIPPPPPPPPFKMPSWRFVVRGDYVKVGSMDSSPDDSPASTPTAADGGGAAAHAQLFCPSPDVDTKADMFIAKFRAGLKLQKMNSMIRQNQGLGLSNLGPDARPRPGPSEV